MTAKTAEELWKRLQANVHAVISELHGYEPPDARSTWPSEDALMVTAKAYAEALARERAADLQGQVDDLCEELGEARSRVTALEKELVRWERWANRIGIVVGDLLVEYHIKAEHQGKCLECNRTPCLSVLGALRTRPARAAPGKEAQGA